MVDSLGQCVTLLHAAAGNACAEMRAPSLYGAPRQGLTLASSPLVLQTHSGMVAPFSYVLLLLWGSIDESCPSRIHAALFCPALPCPALPNCVV